VTPGEVTPLIAAVICVVPAATPVAKPDAEIVAVAGVPEAQVAVAVMSAVDASLKVAVAVNCCVEPTFRWAGGAGVTAIEVIAITVSVTPGEVTPLIAAVIEVVPWANAVANPDAEIVAVAVVAEFHVTVAVMSEVDPSLKVAVAVNCCVDPTFKCAGEAGVTAIDFSVFPECRPLQPTRTLKAKTGNSTAAKRRGRDFMTPPRTGKPDFLGGIPT